MAQEKYDVFISYSRKDYVDENMNVIPSNVVSTIKDRLTAEGISYWFDEEGIYSGQNFVEKIVTNIEASRVFLFLSTANANASPWTCKEIASADEFNKLIIPVRIDRTPYNKKVLFRIADLNYIEYYVNPQKALDNMVDGIKAYLDQLQKEERRKQEEEVRKHEEEREKLEEQKRLRELEEKRLQEKQERLVTEIKLLCTALNNEEVKLELDRENLRLKAEGVPDVSQRATLIDLIEKGGTIHQKYQKEQSELAKEIEKFKSAHTESLEEIKSKDEQISRLRSELQREQLENGKPRKKASIKSHIVYWGIILSVLLGAIILLNKAHNERAYWELRQNATWKELHESEEAKETIDALSDVVPFVITEIDIKNAGENWGDNIYSSKATFFIPKIKYIGLKTGTYQFDVKIYDNRGNLSQNKDISPTGYTRTDAVPLYNGNNETELLKWGYDTPGYWPAGTYRIEIWYKGQKLAEKRFGVLADD